MHAYAYTILNSKKEGSRPMSYIELRDSSLEEDIFA